MTDEPRHELGEHLEYVEVADRAWPRDDTVIRHCHSALPVIGCHWLSLRRGLHIDLAVIAATAVKMAVPPLADRAGDREDEPHAVAVVVDARAPVRAGHDLRALVLHALHMLHLVVVGEPAGVEAA